MDAKKVLELTKKIREATGYGIMDIKKALEETGGDEVKTLEILKKKGVEAAAKRAEKATSQGKVASYIHATGKIGAMVELLCETDFVARGEDFTALSRELAIHVAAMNPADSATMLEQEFVKDPSRKIKDMISELTGKVGENIKLGKIARIEI